MRDTSQLARFVILRHDVPPGAQRASHFDWMFSVGDRLATWTTAELPVQSAVPAERIDDHRMAYLDYEGPISGGRGSVHRIDSGVFECIVWEEDYIELYLHGETRQGVLVLQSESGTGWRLSFSQSIKESARRDRP